MKRILLLLALVGCASKPPTDKRVIRTYVSSKTESRPVYGGKGGWVEVEVPAYYLVANDGMVCEVEQHEYRTVEIGHLASCVWEDVAP